MKPVNSKSLFHLLCITLEKLDSGEIDVSTASATAKLVAQANNLLNYELKRAMVMSNHEFAAHHRNLELKSFDSLNP
jgi:uncharacterized membrane protein (DUF4010 family)